MTHLEFYCSDEKATALLKAARLYDEGVELEPVRHGEWKQVSDDDQYEGTYVCSECEEENFFAFDEERYHYCPHCGAKMRGSKQDV